MVSVAWRQRIAVWVVLWVTAVFRLYGLDNLSPPGLEHDEVAHWLINQDILAGQHAIYFTEAYGHEAAFHYLQTAFMWLLGDNTLALRLPAAFAGLLGVAAAYALTRRLVGRETAVWSAAFLAVLFFPVFYGRLGLRAISLPLLTTLSAYFWWVGWADVHTETQRHGETNPRRLGVAAGKIPHRQLPFLLAGLFAGLSLHTYMAARAVPIFYGLWTVYLALFQRAELRRHGWGLIWFWLVYALVAGPLLFYLLTHPGAEVRLGEVNAPLVALWQGDWRPILGNAGRILAGFAWRGDPLWRQGVAGRPIFDPVTGVLFYGGVVWAVWQWRQPRPAFLLLWAGTAVLPSLVTIDAPSTIRMINLLPVLSIFPVQFIHIISELSPKKGRLSTKRAYLWLVLLLGWQMWGTAVSTFRTWPQHPEVRFVWQSAFTQIATYLDTHPDSQQAVIAGWSPDTMDVPTLELLLRRRDLRLSFFSPEDGTLILPGGAAPTLFRPTILALDPFWTAKLAQWGFTTAAQGDFTQMTAPALPVIHPQMPGNTLFGDGLRFLGYDLEGQSLVTYWRVEAVPTAANRLFLHLLEGQGQVVAEEYHWDTADPQFLWAAHWQPGDLILQQHRLVVPETAVQFRLGVFDPYTCTPGPCQNLPTDSGPPFLQLDLIRGSKE